MATRKVKAPMFIEDGKHTGKIIKIEYTTEPHEYVDVWIEESEQKLQLKAGYPDNLTPTTALGKLLSRFKGAEVEPGNDEDIDKILIGRDCTFMTLNKESKDMTFCNVIRESLKPATKEEVVK